MSLRSDSAQNEEASIISKVLLAASYADRVLVLTKGLLQNHGSGSSGWARVIPLAGGRKLCLKSSTGRHLILSLWFSSIGVHAGYRFAFPCPWCFKAGV